MNTPDTEKECCERCYGIHYTHPKSQWGDFPSCACHTPDTEWEKLVKLNRTCDCTLGWCTECLKWKGVIELALTSRDTYWKERHAKEVNKILNLHSKPIAEGGLDYVKAFEEMEKYEHELFQSIR